MPVDCDLHVHGRYSIGVSASQDFLALESAARRKGLGLLGTGDILHPRWREEFGRLAEEGEDGFYVLERRDGVADHGAARSPIRFVPTTEVETRGKVHHLLVLESLRAADALAASLRPHSSLASDGRPRVSLDAGALARLVIDHGGLIGPAHAFTPWTSLFGSRRTLEEGYGEAASEISFLELGLSADSSYADRISALHPLVYLTGSDAHSAHPAKFGREFTRIDLRGEGFEGLRRAVQRNSSRVAMNVGVPPEHGKYNRTACTRCHRQFEPAAASAAKWKCGCGGRIKMGVRDRVAALGDLAVAKHPAHRPPYRRMLPLAELVGLAIGRGPATKRVAELCDRLVRSSSGEIAVLLETPEAEIAPVAGAEVARVVRLAREEKLVNTPGGGGKHGTVALPDQAGRA